MTSPITANGINDSHTPSPACHQPVVDRSTLPTTFPAAKTSTMAGSATSMDTADLLTR